jgi:hypothetical protein
MTSSESFSVACQTLTIAWLLKQFCGRIQYLVQAGSGANL